VFRGQNESRVCVGASVGADRGGVGGVVVFADERKAVDGWARRC
jgi:hypothetical protein